MDPEAWLGSLEPIGWRFGLERIRRLLATLGLPQHRFASIHVVGTNGKSSVAMMAAKLLEAAGAQTGVYLSPHGRRWSQRILIGGAEISAAEFAAAADRVAEAVGVVDRSLPDGEVVTQFEAATAVAFTAFANAGVELAAVEAGLGGRLDATNVLPSRVTALTSIGLDHTEYLGETVIQIAAEKLAVLRDHSVLVTGALAPEVRELAEEVARERHARLVDASEPLEVGVLANRAPYHARNLAVAVAAAEAFSGPVSAERLEEVSGSLALEGRMEIREGSPPVILDAAHNPDGAQALAEALGPASARRPVVACVAILSGKDAAGFLAALAPALDAIVCTELAAASLEGSGRPGSRPIAARELARLADEAGIADVRVESEPAAAMQAARALARERHGVALATGSHYLLRYGS